MNQDCIEPPSDNICILTCENLYSCVNIDIQLHINSALIMAYTNSCKSVSIYGNGASPIVLESTERNDIIKDVCLCHGDNYYAQNTPIKYRDNLHKYKYRLYINNTRNMDTTLNVNVNDGSANVNEGGALITDNNNNGIKD